MLHSFSFLTRLISSFDSVSSISSMRWPSRFRLMSGVDLRGMLALLASRGAGDEEGTNGVAVMEAQVVGPGVLDFEAVVSAGVGRNSSVVLLEGT